MSTKIYNGYKLKNMSLLKLQGFTMRVREAMEKVGDVLYYNTLAAMCANLLDQQVLLPEDKFKAFLKSNGVELKYFKFPLLIAFELIRDWQQKVEHTQERDPEVDFNCELVIYPIGGKLLMQLFAERKEYREALEAFPEVTPYPYWNNTDRPDDISERQWDKRCEDWNKALGETGIPSLQGFGVKCVLNRFLPDNMEKVLENMPSYERRVNHHASNFIIKGYYNKHHKSDDKSFGVYRAAVKYLESEQGQKEFEAEKQRISALLKPCYTKEDLTKKLIEVK